jgi:hypothetical protein
MSKCLIGIKDLLGLAKPVSNLWMSSSSGPPIYFSYNGIVWSVAHDNVRLGMGALRRMVETLFKDLTTCKELDTIAFGKR